MGETGEEVLKSGMCVLLGASLLGDDATAEDREEGSPEELPQQAQATRKRCRGLWPSLCPPFTGR
jgi:hypothetical protein